MNKCLFFVLLVTAVIATMQKVKAQDKTDFSKLYVADGIPDSLKDEADAVVRYADQQITIKGPGLQHIKYHSIVTILNEKGDDEATQVLGYERKYNTFSYVEMKIYDAAGKMIKKYRKSDMYDRSASDNETIVTDDRTLSIQHVIASYPATVEFEFEEDLTSTLGSGSWSIQPSYRLAVQKASCQVTVASALNFRYKNKNINLQPVKSKLAEYDVYNWEVNNLKAFTRDGNALSWQVSPRVIYATDRFNYYGNTGNFSSWQAYGDWAQQLSIGGTNLSPQRAEEIRKMTDSIKTEKGKARFLYKYMQKNMRYISIQLGIGGLKPFPADFVDQKRYGDCKALSNYMAALLKAVNINSYCAYVRAGVNAEPADPGFPYDNFNHMILCIPFKSDTTWLECTSNTDPFGKLGAFTENRNALLLTENGGKLVNTPKSLMTDNQLTSIVHLVLNPDGGAKAQVRLVGTGEYQRTFTGLMQQKPDDQKEIFIRSYHMKQPVLFNINETDINNNAKEVNLELEYDKFCDIMSGDKQFYRPSVFDLWSITLPVNEKRKKDFYFEHPMQKSCVTTIELPAGYEAESVPADVKLNFDYGVYTASYTYDKIKNQVTSTVKFNMNTQVIPAQKYTVLQQYLDNVQKAQNKKLVIHRKAA